MYNGSGLPLAQFGGYLGVSGGGGDMYNTYLTRYNIIIAKLGEKYNENFSTRSSPR